MSTKPRNSGCDWLAVLDASSRWEWTVDLILRVQQIDLLLCLEGSYATSLSHGFLVVRTTFLTTLVTFALGRHGARISWRNMVFLGVGRSERVPILLQRKLAKDTN